MNNSFENNQDDKFWALAEQVRREQLAEIGALVAHIEDSLDVMDSNMAELEERAKELLHDLRSSDWG